MHLILAMPNLDRLGELEEGNRASKELQRGYFSLHKGELAEVIGGENRIANSAEPQLKRPKVLEA